MLVRTDEELRRAREAGKCNGETLRLLLTGDVEEMEVRALLNFLGNAGDLRAMHIQVHSNPGNGNIFTITATPRQLRELVCHPATQHVNLPRMLFPVKRVIKNVR